MQYEGYRVTAEHEASHWWFRSRRVLVLAQVGYAAAACGFPARRLRLLDYGCGTGFNLPFLARFGEVHGADLLATLAPEFRRADAFPLLDLAADLDAYAGRFDVVTALDVLEHLDDDVAGLRHMRRLLAPGGQMVLTVPAYDWLWGGEDVISRHWRRYSKAALLRACGAAGLTARWVSYFNLLVLPAAAAVVWARRLLNAEGATTSNLDAGPGWLNGVLARLTGIEARLVGHERVRLPAGASLVCRLEAAA